MVSETRRLREVAVIPAARWPDLRAAVARGDQAAFGALYDATASQIFGTVLGVVRDRSQSEEITQEVFIDVWRHAARFDPATGSARTWILTMAHRRAVDRCPSVGGGQ
ncbi:MAG TPA: sigma factor [Jiangellaceae bacterium]